VIELTTLLGPDAIGPGGLTGRGTQIGLLAGVILLVVLFAAVVASAVVETASWRRLRAEADWAALVRADGAGSEGAGSDDSRSEGTGSAMARPAVAEPPERARSTGRIVLALAGVALACLIPALVAAAIAMASIVDAARTEILLPGSLVVPLEVRIAQRAAPAVAFVGLGLVIGELLHGIASRRVLSGAPAADDLGGRPASDRIREALQRSVGAIATSAAGWLVWSAAAVPAVAATAICWTFVRAAYRDAGRLSTEDGPLLVGATVLFVAVWLIALVVCGFASAVRAGLWTARAQPVRLVTGRAGEAAARPHQRADRSGRLRPDDAVR
jgi:hypothetical protein